MEIPTNQPPAQYTNPGQPAYPPQNTAAATGQPPETSTKSFVAAWVLSYFLGSFAIDRFYLGYIGTGVLKLITGGGFGVWQLVDLVRIAYGGLKDKQGGMLQGYYENKQWAQIVTLVTLVLGVLVIPGVILLTVFLSVPAMQRNSRDTQRKNDMSVAATSIYNYAAAHGGSYPSQASFDNGNFKIDGNLSVLTQSDLLYTAMPTGCDEVKVPCTSYNLKTKLENGSMYTVNP